MAHMEVISSLCDIIKCVVQLANIQNTNTPPQLKTRQSEVLAERVSSDALRIHVKFKNKVDRQESTIKGVQAQGPWGGNGGIPFCDGLGTSLKQMKLKFDAGPAPCIWYMEVDYAILGKSFTSRHGNAGRGSNTVVVKVDGPSEYITQIEGSFGIVPYVHNFIGVEGLTSLTIRTNEKTHGPFGGDGRKKFKSDVGRIIGFYGTSGELIDQIGCFIAPVEDKGNWSCCRVGL